jgi:dTDP-4-dehydrorhamnose 3,5-epimerase
VLVDLRTGSSTFLQHCAVELSRDNDRAVFIPEGCAHGFQALEDDCELLYLHTEFYNKVCEGGVRYDEPRLGIAWPLPIAQLSVRDAGFAPLGPGFKGLAI